LRSDSLRGDLDLQDAELAVLHICDPIRTLVRLDLLIDDIVLDLATPLSAESFHFESGIGTCLVTFVAVLMMKTGSLGRRRWGRSWRTFAQIAGTEWGVVVAVSIAPGVGSQ